MESLNKKLSKDTKLKFLIIGLKMEILLKFQDKMLIIKLNFMDMLKKKEINQFGIKVKLLLLQHMIVQFQDMTL